MYQRNKKQPTYIRKVVGDVKREYKKSLEQSKNSIKILNELPLELQFHVLDNYSTYELINICQRYGNLIHLCKNRLLWESRVRRDFNLPIPDDADFFEYVQYLYSPLYDGQMYFDIMILPPKDHTVFDISQLFNIILTVEDQLDDFLRRISSDNVYFTKKKLGRFYYSNVRLLPELQQQPQEQTNNTDQPIGYVIRLIPKIRHTTIMALADVIDRALQYYPSLKTPQIAHISVKVRSTTDIPTSWKQPITSEWLYSVYDDEDQQEDEDEDEDLFRPDPEFPYELHHEFTDGTQSSVKYSHFDNEDEDDNLLV